MNNNNHGRMPQILTHMSPQSIAELANNARWHREAIDWIQSINARCTQFDDIPLLLQREASEYIYKRSRSLQSSENKWFREGARQLNAFIIGNFQITPYGGVYGDGKRIDIPAVTKQVLNEMRTDHLCKHMLYGLKSELRKIEDRALEMKSPNRAVRMFSKTARRTARTLKEISMER